MLDKRGFSAPRMTDNPEKFARFDRELHSVQCLRGKRRPRIIYIAQVPTVYLSDRLVSFSFPFFRLC